MACYCMGQCRGGCGCCVCRCRCNQWVQPYVLQPFIQPVIPVIPVVYKQKSVIQRFSLTR